MYSSRIRSLQRVIASLKFIEESFSSRFAGFSDCDLRDLKNLLFQLTLERSGRLPNKGKWMNPMFTSPENGNIYYAAFLSWERVPQPDRPAPMVDNVTPKWDVELLAYENGSWLTLEGNFSFWRLPAGTDPSRPIHLFATGDSFGHIDPVNMTRGDQIFHCCKAEESLREWSEIIKESIDSGESYLYSCSS